MNRNWSTGFPNEVLEHILLYLQPSDNIRKRDILECVRVCKNWKDIAQIILYRNIRFWRSSELQRFELLSSNDDSPIKHTKSVVLLTELCRDNFNGLNFLERISSVFPFVEHIVREDATEEFYNSLTTLHKQSIFNQLKSIPTKYTSSSSEHQSYFNCALEYNNTRTKLEFPIQWERESYIYFTRESLENIPDLLELHSENNSYTIGFLNRMIDYFPNLNLLRLTNNGINNNFTTDGKAYIISEYCAVPANREKLKKQEIKCKRARNPGRLEPQEIALLATIRVPPYSYKNVLYVAEYDYLYLDNYYLTVQALIKDNGEFIEELILSGHRNTYIDNRPTHHERISTVLQHTFEYCSNLKFLRLDDLDISRYYIHLP